MQTLRKIAKSIERFRDSQMVERALQKATNQALERHKRLGESVAVWQDGKVVVLEAKDIPDPELNSTKLF